MRCLKCETPLVCPDCEEGERQDSANQALCEAAKRDDIFGKLARQEIQRRLEPSIFEKISGETGTITKWNLPGPDNTLDK